MHGNFLFVTLNVTWIAFWMGIFNPYISVYFKSVGGTNVELGLLFALSSISSALVHTPGGYFCDHYGRRKIMIIGGYFTTIAFFIRAVALEYQGFFIGHLLFYFSLFWVTAEAVMLMDSIPEKKRGLGFAVNGTIMGLAGIFSNYIGGWIFDTYGTSGMRVILFIIAFAELVKVLCYTKFLTESIDTQYIVQFPISPTAMLKQIIQSFKSVPNTLKWMPKPLLGFSVTSLLISLGGSITGTLMAINGQMILGSFFVLYAIDVMSISMLQWGFLNALVGGIRVMLLIPGGLLADKYGKRIPIILYFAATSMVTILFILSESYNQVIAVMVLASVIGSLTSPALRSITVDYTPPQMRGQVQSALQILRTVAVFFGSLVSGYLYDVNHKLPFQIYAFFALLAGVTAFLTIRE